jgi:hypothetical protein
VLFAALVVNSPLGLMRRSETLQPRTFRQAAKKHTRRHDPQRKLFTHQLIFVAHIVSFQNETTNRNTCTATPANAPHVAANKNNASKLRT